MSNADIADYIVVGAGSAGCVIANRLSEDRQRKIVILEVGGGDRKLSVRMPGGIIFALADPTLDWGYTTEPDPTRCNRVEKWPRGRLLGGSGSINGLFFVRGAQQDYDRWAELGADGWSFSDLLPLFKRMESTDVGDDSMRGRSGPLRVMESWALKAPNEVFFRACQELQLPLNRDYNGPDQYGVGLVQTNQRRGARDSSATAFLRPALKRPNLELIQRAHVTRIQWEGKRAIGIEYIQDGVLKTLLCRREVILSGGSINSPQLLMLSGVGPAEHLTGLGIPVIQDLPGVGQNLMDHPAFAYARRVTIPTLNHEMRLHRMLLAGIQWALFGSGPASVAAGGAVAFIKTQPSVSCPDIQISFSPFMVSYETGKVGFPRENGLSIMASLQRSRSRGYLKLKTASALDSPLIQPFMFQDPYDLDTLARGVRFVEQIYQTQALKAILSPSDTNFLPANDEDLHDLLRNQSNANYHPSGTCKMGQDENAVVDPRLHVRGVEGLRVADASIFPSIISGNTNAAAMVVGEKASDLIKAEERGRAAAA
jgi:choline dehydrogenase